MALVRLVQARDAEDDEPLWAILSGGDLAFLDDEAPRAVEVRDLIRRLHAMAGRVAVADVLKALLDETVYRAALYRADQARGVYNLDKLLTDAHTSEMVSLGAFLDYVRQLRDVGVREGEARTLASGAVQVMTVHASKGLEFPVVVLGDAARQPPQVRGPLIDPDNGVVLPLKDEVVETDEQGQHTVREVSSSIYQLVRAKEQDQDAAEGDRLLYVAATRAREMVLISASVRGRPSGWLARLATALDLDDLHDGEGDGIRTLDLALGEGTARCTIYPEDAEVSGVKRDRTAENVPGDSGALPPERLPLLDPWMPDAVRMDEAAVEATRDPPQRVWQVVPVASQTGSLQTGRPSAPAWVVGQIVHGALAQWHFPAAVVGRTAGGGDGAFDAWAVAEARGYGITDDAEIGDAVRRAARMLGRFQTTDLYDRMSAATRRLHEVPYSLLREGVLETGVMDALFEDGHGWTLVEFKTDYVAGAGRLEALLAQEDYVDQVARYVTAVEPVLGERPEPVLCFLNYGGVVRLVTGRW
jgi:ATP-dependent helicase/nuclease subunit A